ncbi:MAG: MauE/DoxX family redox-associated membrane protein [Actinomycetes bacterium]
MDRGLGGALGWVAVLARVAVGVTFVAAGLLKVGNPNEAVLSVVAYHLVPFEVARIIGYGLPFLEIALGALLILGLARRLAAMVVAVLLVVFIGAISSAGLRGLAIDCGCFGTGGPVAAGATTYLQEIGRDLLLLAGAVIVVVVRRPRLALDGLRTSSGGHRREPYDTSSNAPEAHPAPTQDAGR